MYPLTPTEHKLNTEIKASETKISELEHDNNSLYERAKLAEIELELALRNLDSNSNKVKELVRRSLGVFFLISSRRLRSRR